jgi:uncharacterized membrane protein
MFMHPQKDLINLFHNLFMADQSERFDTRDLIQSAVGSLAGAMIYAYQADVARIADSLPNLNIALMVIITLALSFFIGYMIGVRRLGKKRMKTIFGIIPLRVIVHYCFALVFSAFMLWLLGMISYSTALITILRRVIVLSLPATLLGSTIDLVESQKD